VDLYLKVRRAHFQDGLSGRQIARDFGLSRDSVSKMLAYPEPPGYRRTAVIKRPKLDAYADQIDQWLAEDKGRPRKQRHTAKRIFERLRDECGFDGGHTIVKDFVRIQKRGSREMFVPLSHPPGHAQADFGKALVVIGGVEQKAYFIKLANGHLAKDIDALMPWAYAPTAIQLTMSSSGTPRRARGHAPRRQNR